MVGDVLNIPNVERESSDGSQHSKKSLLPFGSSRGSSIPMTSAGNHREIQAIYDIPMDSRESTGRESTEDWSARGCYTSGIEIDEKHTESSCFCFHEEEASGACRGRGVGVAVILSGILLLSISLVAAVIVCRPGSGSDNSVQQPSSGSQAVGLAGKTSSSSVAGTRSASSFLVANAQSMYDALPVTLPPPNSATPPPTPPLAHCNASQPYSNPVAARKIELTGEWADKCFTENPNGHWVPPAAIFQEDAQRNWCWVEMKEQADNYRFASGQNEKPPNWWAAQADAYEVGRAPDPWDQVIYALFDHEVCDIPDNGKTMGLASEDPYSKEQQMWDKAGEWFVNNVEVFVINLASNIARLEGMTKTLGNIGITFTRVEGVDMREENALQKAKGAGFVPVDWDFDRVLENLAEQFPATDTYDGNGFIDSEFGLGTVGCTAAHLKAMRMASTSTKPLAIIFEDDSETDGAFVLKLYALLHEEVPCDWQAINLDLYVPYGKCISPHLARIQPDANEPQKTCGHGASWSFASVLYKVSELPFMIDELAQAVWDMDRPSCLVHDVAFASLADRISYYAVPAQQLPGFSTVLHVQDDEDREAINR